MKNHSITKKKFIVKIWSSPTDHSFTIASLDLVLIRRIKQVHISTLPALGSRLWHDVGFFLLIERHHFKQKK